ncbi:MAG TPA: glutathione-disulfide reductase [Burkholderiaceae bacterium]|nr:glutathione-disulfide reductase [Steroidobacteraceae bacterium]HQR77956.1 glutathione-disulfide reductase [Burkholderiaceae bacterium]
MFTFDADLLVIGGGSGGVRAARMAAARGARVVLAEAAGAAGLGGTCVNVGCIPKKLYSYAAHYAEAFEESRGFGWQPTKPQFDWSSLKRNRRAEIGRLNSVYQKLLDGSGVQTLFGRARFLDAHTVQVDCDRNGERTCRCISAPHILVATGGRPDVPDFPGREHTVTSNEMFDLDPFPSRLVVVGGGYVACEFASIFNGLGSRVTQIYRGPQVLRGFDDDIRAFLGAELVKKGVDLRLNARVSRIEKAIDGLHVTLQDGHHVTADVILCATGRVPNVEGLGLDRAGVAQGPDGAVLVDDHYRTNVPSIYAIGDVTARVQLTPVALGEAMAVVDRLFAPPDGKAPRTMDYELIPTAVFTHPSVGTVGMTEAEARKAHGAIEVYRSDFKALRHTLSGSSERTLMKLVVDAATDRVVGLHMVGADAGEIVQGFAVAMRSGATKADFDRTVGIHPTAAEEFVTMREPVRRDGPKSIS